MGRLELELGSLTKSDKQKSIDLKRLAEEHEREMLKIRTENRKEVKRIMEEVKSKEKQMNSMQRELSGQIGQMALNQIEKEAIEKRLMEGRVEEEAGAADKGNAATASEGDIAGHAGATDARKLEKTKSSSKIPVLQNKRRRRQLSGDASQKGEEEDEGGAAEKEEEVEEIKIKASKVQMIEEKFD